MRIAVSEATVQTAVVEVKTLTISGKQVTLAVFRQLQEEDWDGVGQMWGSVNYCPDKECKKLTRPYGYSSYRGEENHVHVVWQKGSELRRCLFVEPARDPHFLRHESEQERAVIRQQHAAYVRVWEYVNNLPQLFIAV